MRTLSIFLLAFCITLTSCQLLMKGYYGIRTPKPIDDERIMKHQLKWFGEKEKDTYFIAFEAYKQLMNEIEGIPAIKVFDYKGQQITYLKGGEYSCSGRAAEFIANLNVDSTYNYVPGTMLSNVLPKLASIDKKKSGESISEDADFYIVAYWASFAGKLNRRFVYEPLSRHDKNDKVELILVNCDVRKSWGDEKLRKLGF